MYRIKKEDLIIRAVQPICVKHALEKVIKSTMQEREFLKRERENKTLTKRLCIYVHVNLNKLEEKI